MPPKVNNDVYHHYGDRWYLADDDPVALLRAEGEFKNEWIAGELKGHRQRVLDLGCGGGFLANRLSFDGHEVTGVDISQDALATARRFDRSGTVNYLAADVANLPFADGSFDVVCAMDLLEHVEDYPAVLREAARVLRPGGRLYFHTFNRTLVAWAVIIKLVEWLVPNTPKNLHVLSMFIRPAELESALDGLHLRIQSLRGIRPVLFSGALWWSILRRRILPGIRFSWSRSLLTSYAGVALKAMVDPEGKKSLALSSR